MNVRIRPETVEDYQAIGRVHREAFGGQAEADLVESLREGGFAEVSLVALLGESIVGHILFSRVTIATQSENWKALSLAPLGVLPSYQCSGVGSLLMEAGLKGCRDLGEQIVVVLGHPNYYPRFGFKASLAQPLDSPFGGGDSWMALELVDGALDDIQGRVLYPPPFVLFE